MTKEQIEQGLKIRTRIAHLSTMKNILVSCDKDEMMFNVEVKFYGHLTTVYNPNINLDWGRQAKEDTAFLVAKIEERIVELEKQFSEL